MTCRPVGQKDVSLVTCGTAVGTNGKMEGGIKAFG